MLFALFAMLAYALVGTQAGLRFIVARALPADGSVKLVGVDGSLWSGARVHGVTVAVPGLRVQLHDARVELALAPLWRGALHLRRVDATGLRIDLIESPSTDRAAEATTPDLPELRIDQLVLVDTVVVRGESRWDINRLQTRLSMHGHELALSQLQLVAAAASADGSLSLDLARDLPLADARLNFTARAAEQDWRGALEAQTRRGVTGLTLALEQPLQAAVALGDLRGAAHWDAFVQVPEQSFHGSAISASLQVQTRERELRVRGQAGFAGLRLTAIDTAARLDDAALLIAPSTFELASPQGRVGFSGRLPFAASEELALQLQSASLRWAAADAPALELRGKVAVSGTRDAPVLTPALELERAGWPQASLSGAVAWRDQAWHAQGLQLVSAASSVQLDGVLPIGDGPDAPLALRLNHFDPALFATDWPGSIDAELAWLGRHAASGFSGELSVSRLDGVLRGRAVQGSGALMLRDSRLASADLALSAGSASLRMQRESLTAPLRFELLAVDLADVWPEWQGRVQANASFDQGWTSVGELTNLRGPGFALAQASWHGVFGATASARVDIGLTMRDLQYGEARVARAQLGVTGTRAAHSADLDLQMGTRELQLAGEGGLDPQLGWQGRVTGLDLLTPELRASLIDPAALTWQGGAFVLARGCLAGEGGGRVCLQLAREAARTDLVAEVVALDLQPLFALFAPQAPFATAARLSGSIDLALEGTELVTLNARVDSVEGAMRVDERPDLDLGYRDFTLDLHIADGRGQWQSAATLRPEGQVDTSGTLERRDGHWQYEGRLQAKMHRFDAIEAFTSQLAAPRGDLSGELQFRGRLGERPQWSGALAVTGFAAELPELGLQLSDGALAIAAVPEGVIVRGAITSGGGQLILDGGRGAEAGARWHFALNGDKAVLADTSALRLVVSPALTLTQREDDWRLGGRVVVPAARIDAEALAPSEATSSDVVIVDAEHADEVDATRWSADVQLELGDDARLVGYGFDGRVRGELRLRQRSSGAAYGTGQLQVSGRYAAYGQRLSIRRGRILYADSPLDEPTLDIEAERKAGSAVAGVRVTGTARMPRTEIYSRPSLPESEALALLVTGRNLRNVGAADRQRLSNAALALGTIGGDLLADSLGAEIGITGDAARGTEAFTIGKYLTPKLFIGYGVGLARRGSVLIVRYLIRDDVEFEATSGEQSRASLNYVIER